MKNPTLVLLIFISLNLLFSCNQDEKNKETSSEINGKKQNDNKGTFVFNNVTNPYFEDIESKKEIIRVLNDEGGSYKFLGGSSIEIPQNCFTYMDGTTLQGEVEISLQEFNSISDILLSGISMKYDSSGVTHNFVSAGMFHIEGNKDGKPIKIAENKEIIVNTVTDTPDNQGAFNFYSMSNEGQWEYETTKKASVNPDYQKVERLEKPEKSSSTDLIIETIHAEEGSAEKTMLWKYVGLRPDTINLDRIKKFNDNVIFEKTQESQLSYRLVFKDGNSNFTIPVETVLLGEDYKNELADFEAKMARIENDQEALAAMEEGKFVRSIGVEAFGLYNWDKIYNKNALPIIADISTDINISNNLIRLHQISKSENLLVSFSFNEAKSLRYYPNCDNHFIATAPGNKVSVLHSKDFFEALEKFEESENESIQLTFQKLDKEIASKDELEAVIDEL